MGRLRPTLRGGGQEAVGFGARRQCMFPYTFLLPSRPQPPGPPSILIFRRDRALGTLHPKNTEYPYEISSGQWTYPASPGSFKLKDVERFRSFSFGLYDKCSRVVAALDRAP